MILALLATLGAIVVAFVLYPVFKEAPATGPAGLDETALELAELIDKKAMLYESIQDLDFEKDSGKISEGDYQSARNDYLAQVAAVMEKMDRIEGRAPKKQAASGHERQPEPKRKKARKTADTLKCSSCGAKNPKGSNFCLDCGTAFERTCGKCGERFPAKAKFCNACGAKVGS